LDWDKSLEINEDIEITSLTTRHNSGRTIHRNQTLWSAYSLRLGTKKIFIAGDGGFGSHFDEIGKKYGPFDFGTIENGQYNTSWPANHMFPEQAALASSHLGLKHTVPIHWGRFAISTHKWNDPIQEIYECRR
jgi:L-ascorbate metabolism protein UlaG (beta-lactamase superfamily)